MPDWKCDGSHWRVELTGHGEYHPSSLVTIFLHYDANEALNWMRTLFLFSVVQVTFIFDSQPSNPALCGECLFGGGYGLKLRRITEILLIAEAVPAHGCVKQLTVSGLYHGTTISAVRVFPYTGIPNNRYTQPGLSGSLA